MGLSQKVFFLDVRVIIHSEATDFKYGLSFALSEVVLKLWGNME